MQTLHSCLHHFPGVAIEVDADGIVAGSNGHLDALVGRDLVGVRFAELLDSTSQAKWRRILSQDERANPACTWELVLKTRDSLELRTFLAIWGGQKDDKVLWLLEYSVDPKLELLYGELTELHREVVDAQRQLNREKQRLARALDNAEAAIRTRDEVLAIVSHDLRNPVSTVTMAAELLEMPIPEERKAQQIGIIKRAAEGMNRLIGDLLDVTAIESGHLRIDSEPLHLESIIAETIQMLDEKAASKKLRLEQRVEGELPKILGDRHRLVQVLANLLGNAVKFTPEGGRVTIHATPTPEEILLCVEDTGPGVSEADVPHIFDRYWHTTRRRKGGAGLGLAIAKGIVVAHHGRIWLESAPGEGARFFVALPAEEAAVEGRA